MLFYKQAAVHIKMSTNRNDIILIFSSIQQESNKDIWVSLNNDGQ